MTNKETLEEQSRKALKQMAKLDKLLTTDDRAKHFLRTMTSQRKHGREITPSRDQCTLVDMKNARMVGSGICPKCHGWLGRSPDYVDNSTKK